MQTIDLDGDNSGSASIEILDRDLFTHIHLNHVSTVTIKNCDGLSGDVSLTMDNINSLEGNVIVENCPGITSFSAGNQNSSCHFQFTRMSGLQTVSIGDCLSVSLTDCPVLTTLSVPTANHTQRVTVQNANEFRTLTVSNCSSGFNTVTLINTPKFESGTLDSNVAATYNLQNCFIALSGTATIHVNNSQIGNQIVIKDEASRQKVFVEANGGTL